MGAAGPVNRPGRRLQEATTRPVAPLPAHAAGPRSGARLVRRLVGLARVLTGGLLVLAVLVVVAPWVLGGSGPGADTVIGHVVAALVAVGATALAAHPRTPVVVASAAVLVVPVTLFVLLGVVWWS